jgi:hypothetical protein
MGITHFLYITLCIKLLDEVLVEFNGANYIGKLMQPLGGSMHFIHSSMRPAYPTHTLANKSRNKCPQIQHKKRMNFFIQNEFPLLEFQPKNYNKTCKQNNQKLVTQHSSSVDGMTFPPLVSYMHWCLSAQVLSCPKYNEN